MKLSQVAAAVCVGRVPAMSSPCSACTCHKCCGYAVELLKLRQDAGQVAKLQEDLNKHRDTVKTLAAMVANLQIQCRFGAGAQTETFEHPQRPDMVTILD